MLTLGAGMKAVPVRALEQLRTVVDARSSAVMLTLTVLALGYWLWFGLVWRSFHFDDGTSILVIQGIMEHGSPILPSGFYYYRGLAPNYLGAATALVFGLNNFAMVLPSLLMGIGSLWLVYLFARDALKQPWVGVAAAALLLALQFQTSLSTSPRMYMAMEFFAILAVYGAWRGYIRGEARYRWLTFLALWGAVLSNDQSGALLVAVPLAVMVTRWSQGEGKPRINYLLPLAGLALLFSVHYLIYLHGLPATLPPIAAHSGLQTTERIGLNLDPVNWLGHFLALERLVPLSALLSPLIVLQFFKSFKDRHLEANQGLVYAFLIFAVSGLITMLVVRTLAPRFWVLALPLYATLICASLVYAASWFRGQGTRWRLSSGAGSGAVNASSALIPGMLIGSIAAILAVLFLALGPDRYLALVKEGYGVPCSQGSCSRAIKWQYSELRRVIREDDVIVSTNPLITSYYLGRVDGWFRERIVPTGFSSFESPIDEYFGIQLIDTGEELSRLRDGDQRVWVIIDYKADTFSSPESLALIESSYTRYREVGPMAVYVNSSKVGGL